MSDSELPERWFCKMNTWLPHMASCNFTEAETTAAVYAAYGMPPPAPAGDSAAAAPPEPSAQPAKQKAEQRVAKADKAANDKV
eukprot:jgi/Chlat1/8049/Chrsp73S07534